MKLAIILVSSLVFLAACQTARLEPKAAVHEPSNCPAAAETNRCGSINAVRFLVGEWIANDPKYVTLESWTVATCRTLEGSGEARTADGGDTRSREELRIVKMGDGVFFIAKTSQNEMPVAFRLTECAAGRAVFENDAHDFPKRIEYTASAGDRLTADVSDGGENGFRILYKRRTP